MQTACFSQDRDELRVDDHFTIIRYIAHRINIRWAFSIKGAKHYHEKENSHPVSGNRQPRYSGGDLLFTVSPVPLQDDPRQADPPQPSNTGICFIAPITEMQIIYSPPPVGKSCGLFL